MASREAKALRDGKIQFKQPAYYIYQGSRNTRLYPTGANAVTDNDPSLGSNVEYWEAWRDRDGPDRPAEPARTDVLTFP